MILTSARAVRAVVKRGEELKLEPDSSGQQVANWLCRSYDRRGHAACRIPCRVCCGDAHWCGAGVRIGAAASGSKSILAAERSRKSRFATGRWSGTARVVTEVTAYRTLRPTAVDKRNLRQVADGAADAILFSVRLPSSILPSYAEANNCAHYKIKLAIAAVGPVTANALREAGVRRFVVSADTTAAAVIEALEKHFAGAAKQEKAGAKRV